MVTHHHLDKIEFLEEIFFLRRKKLRNGFEKNFAHILWVKFDEKDNLAKYYKMSSGLGLFLSYES